MPLNPILTQTNPLSQFVWRSQSSLSAAKYTFFSGLLPLFSGLPTKTNPIFSRPNMHYQYQKRRNGGQKVRQKNETNPIVDNFQYPKDTR
jgi:hypothetical protein